MIVPKFIIFFKNYFLETRGGPGDQRDQSEVADRGEMVYSLGSLGSLRVAGVAGVYWVSSGSIFWTIGT